MGSSGLAGLNGKTGEVLRWLIGGIAAVLIAYYTAQGALENRLTALETKNQALGEEIQRSLTRIETDIRELRGEVREAK